MIRKILFILIFISFTCISACDTIDDLSKTSNKPVITVDETFSTEYKVGSTEPNWLDAVEVIDEEDDTIILTDTNVDTSDVDMDSVGSFDVIFNVTDSDGNMSEQTIEITIIRDINVPAFVINSDFTTTYIVGAEEPNWLQAVTVSDEQDGDITLTNDHVDTSNVNMDSVGSFDVIFNVVDSDGNESESSITIEVENYLPVATDGEITIMIWSMELLEDEYLEDIGNKDIKAEDISSRNKAEVYAVAKEFNKIYPNVKINVFIKAGRPMSTSYDGTLITWTETRENFETEYGYYPSIWPTTDLSGDIEKGVVGDLSRFSEDPLYQSLNREIMGMMNYNGFQGGLPYYTIPSGVYVNKSLAKSNNIDIPSPNWTINEYTDFISQADQENFWGAWDTNWSFIETGTDTMNAQLNNYDFSDGNYIDVNSNQVLSLLPYIHEWAGYSVYPQYEIGNVSDVIMDENTGWSYSFFKNNQLLTLAGNPWMMGDATATAFHSYRVRASEWDIYPRPQTAYRDNTVGVVLDSMAVYNYCKDDGNSACSEEEVNKMKISYTFASFWSGDTRAWQAKADQLYLGYNTGSTNALKTSMNDSFPVVTGDEFDSQMNIWLSTSNHELYADESRMPGFHKIIEIWKNEQMWDIGVNTYPMYDDVDGERRENLYEWYNMWNPNIVGHLRTDDNWLNGVYSRLPMWNDDFNTRFEESLRELKRALIEQYGYSEDDFVW